MLHTGERPIYSVNSALWCNICFKSINTKDKLDAHMNSYTGEIQKCNICLKTLITKIELPAPKLGENM